jgi:hypothetical protein
VQSAITKRIKDTKASFQSSQTRAPKRAKVQSKAKQAYMHQ